MCKNLIRANASSILYRNFSSRHRVDFKELQKLLYKDKKSHFAAFCLHVRCSRTERKAISPADMRLNDGILPNFQFSVIVFEDFIQFFSSYLNKPGAIVLIMAGL